jgi:pilus assembly protein Flp/PilA
LLYNEREPPVGGGQSICFLSEQIYTFIWRNVMKNPKDEEGQGLVEYALLIVLIAIVIVLILSLMGRTITTVYAQIYAGLNGQTLDGSGTEYVVTGVDVNVSGAPPFCTVSVGGSVVVFEDGDLAGAGVGVSGSAAWDGGGGSVSGTTDSSGTAAVSGAGGNGNCSGTASITVGGNTKTVSYGN